MAGTVGSLPKANADIAAEKEAQNSMVRYHSYKLSQMLELFSMPLQKRREF